jgi:acyl-CoA synthetase (NDP forming)
MTQTTHIQFPEQAITALSHASLYASYVRKKLPPVNPGNTTNNTFVPTITSLAKQGVQLMETTTVFDLLASYGIAVVPHALVQSEEQAKQVASSIGDVLACKIVSPDISHKTEAGGVLLAVAKEHAGQAFKSILEHVTKNVPEAKTHGVLLTAMITGDGLELIVGMKKEKNLGTLIMVGLGGIHVELFRDTSFRFAPISREDAIEMIHELKAQKILAGLRGKPKLDEEAVIHALLSVSSIAIDIPQIAELDINPLFVQPKGSLVLDARISLQKPQ